MALSQDKTYPLENIKLTKEYIDAWKITGLHLQKLFNEYNKIENSQGNGFNWLRTKIITPSFDSMTFRYKNQVFSILIDLIEFDDDKVISKTTQAAKDLQIKICAENNLLPCLFKIKIRNMKPATGSWNLFDTRTDKKINLFDLVSDTPIEISDWELSNWAVSTVRNYLERDGNKIISFNDSPGISPNVFFEDKSGNKNWVLISVNGKQQNSNVKINGDFQKFSANVLINPINAEKIYRSNVAQVKYSGLKPIKD